MACDKTNAEHTLSTLYLWRRVLSYMPLLREYIGRFSRVTTFQLFYMQIILSHAWNDNDENVEGGIYIVSLMTLSYYVARVNQTTRDAYLVANNWHLNSIRLCVYGLYDVFYEKNEKMKFCIGSFRLSRVSHALRIASLRNHGIRLTSAALWWLLFLAGNAVRVRYICSYIHMSSLYAFRCWR